MNKKHQELFDEIQIVGEKLHKVMQQMTNLSLEDKIRSMLQIQALSYLSERKSATASELGQFLFMSPSSTAQFADRLAQAGLVDRLHDKDDRRIVHLYLTKEGKKELKERKKKKYDTLKKLFTDVSVEELERFLEIQTVILHKLEKKNQ